MPRRSWRTMLLCPQLQWLPRLSLKLQMQGSRLQHFAGFELVEALSNKGLEITFSLPAATITVTPALVRLAIAEFNAVDFGPPSDMLTTAFPARPRAVTLLATN
jgi:hypothetical protein